ncbi:MCP-domain signal transduction protein [Malaciobacter halophilus]|nr:methyl-accepting chemotaxis protein [Malaciobacter halophilus]AXH09339.1 MCP-domain signal transduction protein [Malaciobacter halophilus]
MSIKQKLIAISAMALFGFIALILLETYSASQMKKLSDAQLLVEQIKTNQYVLRKNEKDFLGRKDIKYIKIVNDTYEKIKIDVNKLNAILVDLKVNSSYDEEFLEIITSYKNIFNKLAQKQKEIGLHKKDALYGSLRNSVHKVQDYAKKANDFKLLALVYELRKEEKDFMLRYEKKYIQRFNTKIDSLISSLDNIEIITYLKEYKKDFLALGEAEIKKGLTVNSGLLGELRKTIYSTNTSVKNLEQLILKTVDSKKSFITTLLNIITIIIALLIIATLYYVGSSIIKALKDFDQGLNSFFKYLNNETLDVKLLDESKNDEIGKMSKIINENIKLTKKAIEEDKALILDVTNITAKVKKGYINQQITASTNNHSLNELKNEINEMLKTLNSNISSISVVLKEFSNYKFTSKVDSSGIQGDMKEFIENVNFLTGEISGLLKDSLIIGLTLDEASDKLIANVDVLNTSSNEAAASLEETAAALEEITSTIVNNSENVAKMSNYAQELSNSAKTGQSLANKTTTSMDEINEQVSSINEAITVIDQIAFQTNILSLNAAVEAATAGEAGKGFAVVAAEVRNLATRSAEAAREIKDIVENATSKAIEGKNISAEMIKGYDALLQNIENSTQMISEIANASKEQESGITQINDAVTQLDQQTQKNASIATQTHEIAIQTDTIAKEIVSDANSKEFIGKEEARVKKIEVKEKEEPKAKYNYEEEEYKKTTSYNSKPKQPETFTSQNSDKDDEWESF